MSPPAQPQVATDGRTSRLRRHILAAAQTPSVPDQPATTHAETGPPRPGPPDLAAEGVSQDLLDADVRAGGHQKALIDAPPAPVAHPSAPAGHPLVPQAQDGAGASAPPTGDSPPGEPTLDWCEVCRFRRPSPCDQCPPQQAPPEAAEATAEPAPEGGRMPGHAPGEQPGAASPAPDTHAPREAKAPPPPPIDVDASQGTATELAGLLDDKAGALSPLEPLQPAVVSGDDPEPPAAGHADNPTGKVGPHESRLAALIADTALEEANPCKAQDVAVFLDSERLSAVGRRMRAAGQDTTPVPGPHSLEGGGLPPSWPSMPRGPASCSSSWASPWASPPSPSPAGREMPF